MRATKKISPRLDNEKKKITETFFQEEKDKKEYEYEYMKEREETPHTPTHPHPYTKEAREDREPTASIHESV